MRSLPCRKRILSRYSATVIPLAAADFCTVFINFSSGLLSLKPNCLTNLSASISTAINAIWDRSDFSKARRNDLAMRSIYQLIFAVVLYKGMRPNEYKAATREGQFIVANNSKRKNGKIELKRISINPMLKPYRENVTDLSFVRLEAMCMKILQVDISPKIISFILSANFSKRPLSISVKQSLRYFGIDK